MARIKHGTLVANTPTQVDVGQGINTVEVTIVSNPAPIYFRVDGINPVIEGDDCQVVPAGVGASLGVATPATPDTRLISAGTPKYCVRGL